MKPELSIVIPVYNTGKSAKKLVQSILKYNQNINFEIILIDDGSTDNSLSILQNLKLPKIKIYHQMNNGASSARNLGIKKASGKYLSFLDSDDEISKDFYRQTLAKIKQANVALVSTGFLYNRLYNNTKTAVFTDENPLKSPKETKNEYILKSLLKDGRLYSSVNKLYHTKIIKDNQIFFPENQYFAEDSKFVLDYLKYASGDIIHIKAPLYIYNYGTQNSTVRKTSLLWENWELQFSQLRSWVGNSPTKTEQSLLKKIRLRWRISHALSVARSNQPFLAKIKYINPIFLLLAEVLKLFRP